MPLPGGDSLAQSPSQRAEVPWLSGGGNSHTSTENRATAQQSFPSSRQNEGPGCITECKALTMPPFHLKSSKGCDFYYPRYITLQCAKAANERMPEKCKTVERGEPEACERCEYPNNHTALLAVKCSLLAWTALQRAQQDGKAQENRHRFYFAGSGCHGGMRCCGGYDHPLHQLCLISRVQSHKTAFLGWRRDPES